MVVPPTMAIPMLATNKSLTWGIELITIPQFWGKKPNVWTISIHISHDARSIDWMAKSSFAIFCYYVHQLRI